MRSPEGNNFEFGEEMLEHEVVVHIEIGLFSCRNHKVRCVLCFRTHRSRGFSLLLLYYVPLEASTVSDVHLPLSGSWRTLSSSDLNELHHPWLSNPVGG